MANKTDYRRLYVQMWRDREVRRWDARAKLLFVYLITNESTENCGAYQIMTEDMARETGIPEGEVIALLPALAPSVQWWPATDYVFIPRLYTYQHGPIPNPNYRVSAIRSMCGLPAEVAAAVVAEYPELGVDPAAIKTSRGKGNGGDASPMQPSVALDSPIGASDSPIKPYQALDRGGIALSSPIKPFEGVDSPPKPSRSIPTPIPTPNTRAIPEKARTQKAPPQPAPVVMSQRRDFETFFAAYPDFRKGDKDAAWKAWEMVASAKELPPLATVLGGLDEYRATEEVARGVMLGASKFIMQKRWIPPSDQPQAKPKQPRPWNGDAPNMPGRPAI